MYLEPFIRAYGGHCGRILHAITVLAITQSSKLSCALCKDIGSCRGMEVVDDEDKGILRDDLTKHLLDERQHCQIT